MQITLSAQQSKALEALSQNGGYASLEESIDAALVLLADEVIQKVPEESPEYLEWVEQTRLKIEAGLTAIDRGDVLDADEVLTRLRNKVASARSASA